MPNDNNYFVIPVFQIPLPSTNFDHTDLDRSLNMSFDEMHSLVGDDVHNASVVIAADEHKDENDNDENKEDDSNISQFPSFSFRGSHELPPASPPPRVVLPKFNDHREWSLREESANEQDNDDDTPILPSGLMKRMMASYRFGVLSVFTLEIRFTCVLVDFLVENMTNHGNSRRYKFAQCVC